MVPSASVQPGFAVTGSVATLLITVRAKNVVPMDVGGHVGCACHMRSVRVELAPAALIVRAGIVVQMVAWGVVAVANFRETSVWKASAYASRVVTAHIADPMVVEATVGNVVKTSSV